MAVSHSILRRLCLASSSSSRFTKPFHLFKFSFSTTSPPNPPPIQVSLTHSTGRAVFATRSIPTGDLIHTAEPAVCHPSPSALHPVCYSCLTRLPSSPPQRSPFCSHHCLQRSKVRFFSSSSLFTNKNWLFSSYMHTLSTDNHRNLVT